MTPEGSIGRYPDETCLATEMQIQSFSHLVKIVLGVQVNLSALKRILAD